ncbi:DNA polymerase [Niveispirillum sp. BGYR6]|uniref:DNA polymerase n=1 Tax=Niveispirillum sp. BGYR6 TaxID=2971249 RepID=UPI0022B99E5D|nr:DNA polymerase [Niveispirillum sp. BGYR6]MDG5496959.1 DNA polymerase [Niveispirillum sp. BGYR6]
MLHVHAPATPSGGPPPHHPGTAPPLAGDYRYVTDLADICAAIEQHHARTGRAMDVAIDTSTQGRHPWYPHAYIVSFQVSIRPGQADVLYFSRGQRPAGALLHQINWLLHTDKVKLKGANLKYDLVWLATAWGVECGNFTMDTSVVGSLLDENRCNSLSLHRRLFTGMGSAADAAGRPPLDRQRLDLAPRQALLPHAGGTADACLRVALPLRRQLVQEPRLCNFYTKLLHPALRSFEAVERRGLVVDRQQYALLEQDIRQEIATLQRQLLDRLPARLRQRHAAAITRQAGAEQSAITPALLLDFLFSPLGCNLRPLRWTGRSGQPSLSAAHLAMFADHPLAGPFVALYRQLASAQKMLSTYVVGFLKHLRPDGLFHPTYMLFNGSMADEGDEGDDAAAAGTVTGRLSARDPAVQTIPKRGHWAARLRACFPAPPGHVFFQRDYSQGELRVVACVAQEQNMIRAYRQGIDLHCQTAAQLNGYDLQSFQALEQRDPSLYETLRRGGKAGNFGLLYGMSARGFVDYAWATYGLVLSLDQAEQFRHRFLTQLYPGLSRYHAQVRAQARRDGCVWSPLGRRRLLPQIRAADPAARAQAERQAINSPIQSTLSDMLLWTMAILHRDHPDLWIAGMTHDSLYGYLPADSAPAWMERIQAVMDHLPFAETFGWSPALPFPSDGELGPHLGALKKRGGAAPPPEQTI